MPEINITVATNATKTLGSALIECFDYFSVRTDNNPREHDITIYVNEGFSALIFLTQELVNLSNMMNHIESGSGGLTILSVRLPT